MTVGELQDLLFDVPLSAELVLDGWDYNELVFIEYDEGANVVILKEDKE